MPGYKYWNHRLIVKRGGVSVWEGDDPHEQGVPQCGFWRTRSAPKGPFIGVAIWESNGNKFIKRGQAHSTAWRDNGDLSRKTSWMNFLEPVGYDDYTAWETTGMWPGDVPTTTSNSDNVSPGEQLRETIAEASRDALAWQHANVPILNQLKADEAANWRDRLNKLKKEAETAFKEDKEPLEAAVVECNKTWKPAIATADARAKELRDSITLYGRKLEAEEAKRVALERDRIEAERKKLEDEDIVLASLTPVEKVAPKKASFGGQLGKKTSMKASWRAEFTDYGEALNHFHSHPDVVELVQKLANAEARRKDRKEIPGVKFIEERVAV